jgi:hypothetical protein
MNILKNFNFRKLYDVILYFHKINYRFNFTKKNFSEVSDLNKQANKRNLNETREFLRKNLMRPNNETTTTSTNHDNVQPTTHKPTEFKKKIQKQEEKESSINQQSQPTLKKENAMNNIRFKGIYERNPLDKTSP